MRINVLLLFVGVRCFAGSVLAVQLQHPKRLQAPADTTEVRLKQLPASLRSALQSLNYLYLNMALSSRQTDGLTFLLSGLSERVGLRVAECLSGKGAGWLCHLARGSGRARSLQLSHFGMGPASIQAAPWQHLRGSEPK